jgi:hypothetical protein
MTKTPVRDSLSLVGLCAKQDHRSVIEFGSIYTGNLTNIKEACRHTRIQNKNDSNVSDLDIAFVRKNSIFRLGLINYAHMDNVNLKNPHTLEQYVSSMAVYTSYAGSASKKNVSVCLDVPQVSGAFLWIPDEEATPNQYVFPVGKILPVPSLVTIAEHDGPIFAPMYFAGLDATKSELIFAEKRYFQRKSQTADSFVYFDIMRLPAATTSVQFLKEAGFIHISPSLKQAPVLQK